MSKAATFNAAKYRSNPKAIANYLNDALATDDSAFVRALGNLARAQGMGAIAEEANVDRAGLYRSLRGDGGDAGHDVGRCLSVNEVVEHIRHFPDPRPERAS